MFNNIINLKKQQQFVEFRFDFFVFNFEFELFFLIVNFAIVVEND